MLWVNPYNLDTLLHFGNSIFSGPNASIDAYTEIPANDLGDNFLSIFLHEVRHGLGLWSFQQYRGYKSYPSFFDKQKYNSFSIANGISIGLLLFNILALRFNLQEQTQATIVHQHCSRSII